MGGVNLRGRNSSGTVPENIDTDRDRYPTAVEGLRRVIGEGVLPDGPIERLEVRFLASGEATYRVWTPRAEEPDGGYFPAPDTG